MNRIFLLAPSALALLLTSCGSNHAAPVAAQTAIST